MRICSLTRIAIGAVIALMVGAGSANHQRDHRTEDDPCA